MNTDKEGDMFVGFLSLNDNDARHALPVFVI